MNNTPIIEEFLQESAIAQDVFDCAVSIVPDIEIDSITKEVTGTPLYDLLDWKYTRFGHQAKPNLIGAFFLQETGDVWQGKVFGQDAGKRSGRYYAPKGIGDKVYFPPVPQRVRELVAQKYGLAPPPEDASFWEWFSQHDEIPLVLGEGGKKALSALSANRPSVSLYGCLCGAGWQLELNRLDLLDELKPLVRSRKVIIALDQGDTNPKSIRNVKLGIRRLGSAIAKAGGIPCVALWDSSEGKGIDDVATNQGADRVREIIDSAIPFESWRNSQLIDLSILSVSPSVTVNQRYLNALIPDGEKLVVLKGVQGTGKTEVLARHCERLLRAGTPVFVLTHLESLARMLGQRLGVPYRTEKTEQGKILGYSLCVDSLRPKGPNGFNWSDWQERAPVVILDECEQVIWHLLDGTTDVGKYRRIVLDQLQNLIKISRQVILSDADCSDLSIEFIQGLLGEKVSPWMIVNEYQHQGWDVTHFDRDVEWHKRLMESVAQGKKLFIVTAAQKPKSRHGTIAIENRIKQHSPHIRVCRLDRETLSDPNHRAYSAKNDLNGYLSEFDIAIASPSINTGVSIDILGHFDEVWGISTGLLAPTNFVQFLWRLRDDVPRFIHVTKLSNIGLVGNGSEYPNQLRFSQDKLTKLNLAQLREFDDLSADDIDRPIDPIAMRTWTKMGARLNRHNKRYRETVFALLKAQNHRITEIDSLSVEERKASSEVLSKNRDLVWSERSAAIASSRSLTSEEASKLVETQSKTQDDANALRKHQLQSKYGVDATQDLVMADDRGLYRRLRLLYYLTRGRDYVEARDTAKLRAMLEDNQGAAFKPDVNRAMFTAQVKALEVLKIPLLLSNPERELVATDSDLIEIAQMAIANTQEIISLLRLTIHQPKSNPKTGETQIPVIKIIRQLLSGVGYNLVRSTKKIVVQGKRRYTYQLESCISTPTRQSIFDYWLDRDEPNAARSRIAVSESPEQSSQCHDSPNIYMESTNSDSPPVTEHHLPSEAMEPSTGQEKPCHDSPNIYNSTHRDEPLVPKVQDSAEVDLLPLSVEKSVERTQTMKLHPEYEDLVERQSEEDRDFFLLHPDRTWYIRPSSDFERDVPVMNGHRQLVEEYILVLATEEPGCRFKLMVPFERGEYFLNMQMAQLEAADHPDDPIHKLFPILPPEFCRQLDTFPIRIKLIDQADPDKIKSIFRKHSKKTRRKKPLGFG